MVKLIYIDLFCGGGGTTTGVHSARLDGESCAIVAACINHDANAIRSHKSNHKQTLHFTEDITLLYNTRRMSRLIRHVEWMKDLYLDAEVVLWASLECTNFSKAKGGQPRDADSRTLADHLFPYIEALPIDRIQIENVEEFMSWGPLDENGKPISKNSGSDYIQWINKVKLYGFKFEHRVLNSADYGAYTSRKRFFGQFARLNDEIYWPEPTHAEKPQNSLFGKPLEKWRAVKEVLDFSDEGESIFDRKKPLVDATLERIYAGLVKFVAGGKKNFLTRYNSVRPKHTATSIDNPCGTLTTNNRFGIVSSVFLSKAFSGDPNNKVQSTDKPAGSITTKDHHQVIFLQKYYSGCPESKISSIENPSPTITTKDVIAFVSAYYGTGDNNHSINKPCPTVRTKDGLALVQTRYIMNQYTGGGQYSDIDNPCPTISTVPKQNLITPVWLMNTNFNNVGSSVEKPAQVVTANRKYHYLLNPQFASVGGNIEKPCFTLIARMDKMPPYLVDAATAVSCMPSFIKTVDGGFIFEIYETDSEPMARIKGFMAMYGILDIKMRMLRIPELKKIMGFNEDYILIGTQAEQKKFIGNAVEVNIATALVEATAHGLLQMKQVA